MFLFLCFGQATIGVLDVRRRCVRKRGQTISFKQVSLLWCSLLYIWHSKATLGFCTDPREFFISWQVSFWRSQLTLTTLHSFNSSSCESTEEEFCRIWIGSANKKFPTWRLAYCEIHWNRGNLDWLDHVRRGECLPQINPTSGLMFEPRASSLTMKFRSLLKSRVSVLSRTVCSTCEDITALQQTLSVTVTPVRLPISPQWVFCPKKDLLTL